MKDEDGFQRLVCKLTAGRSCARANPLLIHFHFHHLHSKMSTDLPYAADAEDSLSYDELEVRLHLLKESINSAYARASRSFASNTRRRYRSRT